MSTLTRHLIALATCLTTCMHAQTVSPTSYEEVARHLQPGGAFYAYMSTGKWFTGVEEWVVNVRDMVTSGTEPDSQARDQATKAFDMGLRLLRGSGLDGLSGFGMSSVETAPGVFHNRSMLHHFAGQDTGQLWQLCGTEPHELTGLSFLPASTVIATHGDFDIPRLWDWLSAEIARSDLPEMQAGFEAFRAGARAQGVDLDVLIPSLGSEMGLLVVMDELAEISLPTPTPMTIPQPGVALIVKTRDDTLFNLIEEKAEGVLMRADDGERKRLTGLQLPVPFVPVQPTVMQVGDYLIIGSTGDLVTAMLAVHDGGEGLVATPGFQEIAKGVPATGNSFTFVSPRLSDVVKKVQAQALAAMPETEGQRFAFLQNMIGKDQPFFMYSVSRREPDGWTSIGNTTLSAGQAFMMQSTVVPAAVMAGVALPALSKARDRAKSVSCMNNLRQIGLGLVMFQADHNQFPEGLGATGLEALRKNGYLATPAVFVCPQSGMVAAPEGTPLTEQTCSYGYLGAPDMNGPIVPLAFDRPGNHAGGLNVLFMDGHVERIEGSFRSAHELMSAIIRTHAFPAETAAALLERAAAWD